MILYGYKHRNVTLATGQFQCPKCQTTRTYNHINVVRYFTLFFVALFPLGRVGSFIECETCRSAFKPEELMGLPGNERFAQETQSQITVAKAENRQGRGCALVVIGGIVATAGAIALALLVAFQLTGTSSPTEGLGATLCLVGILPLPLLLLGGGLLAWGIRIRQRAAEAALQATSTPLA